MSISWRTLMPISCLFGNKLHITCFDPMMVSHSDDEYGSLLLGHVDELSLSVRRTAHH